MEAVYKCLPGRLVKPGRLVETISTGNIQPLFGVGVMRISHAPR